MKIRRSQLITVLGCLLALLLSNTALAGYACPGQQKAVEIARMVEAAMPCADEMSRAMDDEQPALCHAHCQWQLQSADSFHPPAFVALEDLGVVLTVAQPALRVMHDPGSLLRRETGPPLAIRHCCFRI